MLTTLLGKQRGRVQHSMASPSRKCGVAGPAARRGPQVPEAPPSSPTRAPRAAAGASSELRARSLRSCPAGPRSNVQRCRRQRRCTSGGSGAGSCTSRASSHDFGSHCRSGTPSSTTLPRCGWEPEGPPSPSPAERFTNHAQIVQPKPHSDPYRCGRSANQTTVSLRQPIFRLNLPYEQSQSLPRLYHLQRGHVLCPPPCLERCASRDSWTLPITAS